MKKLGGNVPVAWCKVCLCNAPDWGQASVRPDVLVCHIRTACFAGRDGIKVHKCNGEWISALSDKGEIASSEQLHGSASTVSQISHITAKIQYNSKKSHWWIYCWCFEWVGAWRARAWGQHLEKDLKPANLQHLVILSLRLNYTASCTLHFCTLLSHGGLRPSRVLAYLSMCLLNTCQENFFTRITIPECVEKAYKATAAAFRVTAGIIKRKIMMMYWMNGLCVSRRILYS